MFNLNLLNKAICPSIEYIIGNITSRELSLSTDSRKAGRNHLYIAIKGDQFDGHDYIQDVIQSGTRAIVYNSKKYSKIQIDEFNQKSSSPIVFIACTDTVLLLQELAMARIKIWKALDLKKRVIGITGSNGKTTNKEFLYSLLSSQFPDKVHYTKGNLNNHLGVPFTILDLNDSDEIAIIEMGSNHLGEIELLCSIAQPDCGLITNIGNAHLEFFINQKNIFKEKKSLYNYIVKYKDGEGLFIANNDDEYLRQLPKSNGLTTLGTNADYDLIFAKNGFSLENNTEKILITNKNILEKFNLINLAQTLLLSIKLYPNLKTKLIESAKNLTLVDMNRSQWIDYQDKRIFLDAYNANPTSMKVSLESFLEHIHSKKILLKDCLIIVGDMNELGDATQAMHEDISKYLKLNNVENIIAVGQYRNYYKKYLNTTSFKSYELTINLKKDFKTNIIGKKYIFIKGSRSLKLEQLLP